MQSVCLEGKPKHTPGTIITSQNVQVMFHPRHHRCQHLVSKVSLWPIANPLPQRSVLTAFSMDPKDRIHMSVSLLSFAAGDWDKLGTQGLRDRLIHSSSPGTR